MSMDEQHPFEALLPEAKRQALVRSRVIKEEHEQLEVLAHATELLDGLDSMNLDQLKMISKVMQHISGSHPISSTAIASTVLGACQVFAKAKFNYSLTADRPFVEDLDDALRKLTEESEALGIVLTEGNDDHQVDVVIADGDGGTIELGDDDDDDPMDFFDRDGGGEGY